jgi:hypothetical protein
MASLNEEHKTFGCFWCHLFLSYSNIIFIVLEYWVTDIAFSAVTQELQFQYLQMWKFLSLPTINKIDILETEINGRGDPFRWPGDTLYPQIWH